MTRVRLLGAPSPRMWDELIRSDPTAMVFQTPGWLRSLIRCGWSDGTRLYESDEGRSLVLPMAAPRYTPARAAIVASLPSGWGTGGLVASGGVHPDEVAAVARELARERFLQVR